MRASVFLVVAATAIAALFHAPDAKAQSVKPVCTENTRQCLIKTIDVYLDGLSHHDGSKVPFAADVRCTEQGKLYVVGEVGYRKELTLNTVPFVDTRNIRYGVDLDKHEVYVFFVVALRLPDPKNPGKMYDTTFNKIERFKVDKGLITEAEIFGVEQPGTLEGGSGWPDQPAH
jgi:hypothetical protein